MSFFNADIKSSELLLSSSSASQPMLTIENTHNGATSGYIKFINDKGSVGVDNDVCGTITFYGNDDNQDNIEFARIEGIVADASNGDECGGLKFYVAENDGNNTVGLQLNGSTTDGEIDVNIGAGTSSLTTIEGILSINSTINKLYIKSNETNFGRSLFLRTDGTTSGTLSAAEDNIGIGTEPLLSLTSGDRNTAIGYQALTNITTGSDNVAIGYQSLLSSSTNNINQIVAIGSGSGKSCIAGSQNVYIGYNAIAGTTGSGDYNVAIGRMSLYNAAASSQTVAVGWKAGGQDTTNASQCIFLGYDSKPNTSNVTPTNQIIIGRNITGIGDNYAVLGNSSCSRVYMAQGGDAVIYANGTIQTSDERIKENIVDINGSVALQYIRDIPCRFYTYKDTNHRGTSQTPGFIAQEVESVFPLAVTTTKGIIPNEYRLLSNYSLVETTQKIEPDDITNLDNYWKLTINDLTDLSDTNTYQFKFSNDAIFDISSINNEFVSITSIENERTSFLLSKEWSNIYIWKGNIRF